MGDRTPLEQLKGIGEKTSKLFQKIHISTVEELLDYYPRDYETFQDCTTISEAHIGQVHGIRGIVCGNPNMKKIRNLTITTVLVKDLTGAIQLTFFNMPYIKNVLKNNCTYIFRGLVQSKGSAKIMEQPRIYKEDEYAELLKNIQPRYALTKGLSNQTVLKAMKQALDNHIIDDEKYPVKYMKDYNLMTRKNALREIHFPKDMSNLIEARKRIVFDEFFDFLFYMRENKEQSEQLINEYTIIETADTVRFLEQLPYTLTKAQKKVWAEIRNDLNGEYCMNRLIQGDVGSGKTIIAVLALLMCVSNGYQGAMMAPTEVLATQHYDDICKFIKKYKLVFKPVLLVGSMTAKEKKEAYEKIASSEANLVIGTHAVIQEKVVFNKLALVVTDEQHRFGVRQREILANKGNNPHVLVMSATPIPRTLAIILYGDLQISVIDELPANRLPIKNCVVNTSFRKKAYEFIESEVRKGRQAYVICPMVDEGETDDLENVSEYTEKLKSILPQDIQIAALHGKMRPSDKSRIMEEFAKHNIDVLVSTTVIEVGINVPNATVMMVENAERFGLAQLHQLRGRVGRGEHQSYCIFISSKDNNETMERLNILNQSNDGFYIASEDMRLRGPGDLFGIRQSGEFSFRMADIYSDANILKQASEAVNRISKGEISDTEYKKLKMFLKNNGRNKVDFRTI